MGLGVEKKALILGRLFVKMFFFLKKGFTFA